MRNRNYHAFSATQVYARTKINAIYCPVCGFREGELLYTVTAAEAAQHFVLKEVDPIRNLKLTNHIADLWRQCTCDYVECKTCGFIFAYPFVGGDFTFYALAYERSGYPKWKWEYQKTADAISIVSSNNEERPLRLLEIGAGDGAFVRRLSPNVIAKDDVLCLEFSEYGRNRILEYGIECLSVDIRELHPSEPDKLFDVICMFQVLEHMDRLEELFITLSRISRNNSHLFVTVPNNEQIEFNEINGCLLDMPPNHISRWNRQVFEKIGTAFGWTVLEYQGEPMNTMDTLKQQVAYRYLKCSQDSSSIANLIERIRSERFRKLLRIVCAVVYALGRMSILFKAVSENKCGDSQWIHFQKL
ncbi:methyltransferase domain-containing protein [Methylomonas sp. LW13]|uniref:class I SAM-dependent methyltransferase n=1 Tax=unclassified Methylomonas TaxID=2608980 RepID=UPI00051C3A5B|nr:class I SAM-dependent methyltransferase [Methylomonas sp. LW13]QBC25692.1 methyltransferase domain-containing protein [Methylomonas sp. LW13]